VTRGAAFLDRDGTLVRDVGYARQPEELELLPGVRESLAELRRSGFLLVVVTNQSGIGRGYLREEDYALQIARLSELLGSQARPDAHYYCPHHPTEALGAYRIDCDCRKPKPGLFLRAIAEHGIDPNDSIAIGDQERDATAARAAGVGAVATIGESGGTFSGAVQAALRRRSSRQGK
jgi:D-glycero-D-manno-heptose 1,7-bisphosphate phosphatase